MSVRSWFLFFLVWAVAKKDQRNTDRIYQLKTEQEIIADLQFTACILNFISGINKILIMLIKV